MPDLVIDSNAPLTGWGAVCKNKTISGRWTELERQEQINTLELRAVLLAAQIFAEGQKASRVLFRCDNKTTVAHVNKMGETTSSLLVAITKQLWKFCLKRPLIILTKYLTGTPDT